MLHSILFTDQALNATTPTKLNAMTKSTKYSVELNIETFTINNSQSKSIKLSI